MFSIFTFRQFIRNISPKYNALITVSRTNKKRPSGLKMRAVHQLVKFATARPMEIRLVVTVFDRWNFSFLFVTFIVHFSFRRGQAFLSRTSDPTTKPCRVLRTKHLLFFDVLFLYGIKIDRNPCIRAPFLAGLNKPARLAAQAYVLTVDQSLL